MGKELVFAALRHEAVIRAPWVPFTGIHSGFLKGYSSKEVLQDKDKLIQSLLEVNKVYAPDGQPVIFDLQVEAEILGCELAWREDTPPMVSSHPLEINKEIVYCIPTDQDGRLPMILSAMREAKTLLGDKTALYGLITGPFTLASHLRGTDIFLDMYDDPEYVKELLKYCADVATTMADLYVEAGMDVIAVVDPMVSQISTEHFLEFLTVPYTEIFNEIRARGVFSSFFVCGNAMRNIEVMCQTKPDSISIDENINIKEAKAISDQYNVTIGGNIQLTVTMLHGTQQANMKAVIDILDACGTRNLIVSPGCDMPFSTPIVNGIAASFAVRNSEEARAMLVGYDGSLDLKDIHIELPDYNALKRPFVEIFTLDSDSCAACGYMLAMVVAAKNDLGDAFDYVEYKFTKRENIKRCMEMQVKNLPSLYLNGKLIYSSLIPSKEELIRTIQGT